MQEQQNIEFYPKGTQDQSKARANSLERTKSLEAVLNFDNEGFLKFLEKHAKISKVIILDTNMFTQLSLDLVVEYIENNEGDETKKYLEEVFLKTKQNLFYFNLALTRNKEFFITNEIIDELYGWNLFWKMSINQENAKIIDDNSNSILRKDKAYIYEVLGKNKCLHSLLKGCARDYLAAIIDIRNYLIKEKRVLPLPSSARNYSFNKLLKKIIWDVNFNGRKKISGQDKKITYDLFLNSLNCSTGLLSMDKDFKILTSKVAKHLSELNKTLKKYDLYLRTNNYHEKFFTNIIHVGHI
jgi:hypothetical protein